MHGELKPSVCIDAVLGDMPLVEAVRTVRNCGIAAFEFWGWWNKDLAKIQQPTQSNDMQISACCTRFISLVDPERRSDYLTGLEESIAAATSIGCRTIISQGW